MRRASIVILLTSLILTGGATDGIAQEFLGDLTELSLEELMNIEITSVLKASGKLSEAAAAITVIKREDIRRFGFTSIPEALRMVPGMHVGRLDSNKWAITCRGFNGRFANKLLVMVDGQTLYKPLYSGVFWETLDVALEDVERIEVIRGPGAALWGANAVNGVINIVTHGAKETQGTFVTLGAGTEEKGFGGLRYGGRLNENTYYRVYAKYSDRDGYVDALGGDNRDAWDVVRGGFRVDWNASDRNTLRLQGNAYDGDFQQTANLPSLYAPYSVPAYQMSTMAGANLVARLERTFSEHSDMALQLHYDRVERRELITEFTGNTFDAGLEHRWSPTDRHQIVWGLEYRLTEFDPENTTTVLFGSDIYREHVTSAFVQDNIEVIRDRLRLTVGSKFEKNDYSGKEFQPNLRLVIIPGRHHALWASVSGASRTPSVAEKYATYVAQILPPDKYVPGIPALIAMEGSPDYGSEYLVAYELGYRVQPVARFSLDLATFYNNYEGLRTIEPGVTSFESNPYPVHLLVPLQTENRMDGITYGVEAAGSLRVRDGWNLHGWYSYFEMDLRLHRNSHDVMSTAAEGENPRHQWFLRSSMDLRRNLELDAALRWVDELPNSGIESYTSVDARLGWNVNHRLDISLVGQNLLDDHHAEAIPEFQKLLADGIPRGMYLVARWGY